VLPLFAARRKVIAVEEQGHGRTTDREGPVTFEGSADDVAALLRRLKVERADLFGFSNGASIALELALRHPGLVRKLVFASAMTKRSGAPEVFWDYIRKTDFSEMPQPLKDAFLRVDPDPVRLRAMHDKDLARMRSFPDVPDDRLRGIQAPTLTLLGDRDVAKPEHAVEQDQRNPLGPTMHLIVHADTIDRRVAAFQGYGRTGRHGRSPLRRGDGREGAARKQQD
jgi:pimeloyl-ACP methyl ester carboxylesterase